MAEKKPKVGLLIGLGPKAPMEESGGDDAKDLAATGILDAITAGDSKALAEALEAFLAAG